MSATKPVAVVTGGAGFIGSHAVDLLLQRGFRVHLIDNLLGGREKNLEHHGSNPNLVVEIRDIRQTQPDDRLFQGARHVLHFAGIPFSGASLNPVRSLAPALIGGTIDGNIIVWIVGPLIGAAIGWGFYRALEDGSTR